MAHVSAGVSTAAAAAESAAAAAAELADVAALSSSSTPKLSSEDAGVFQRQRRLLLEQGQGQGQGPRQGQGQGQGHGRGGSWRDGGSSGSSDGSSSDSGRSFTNHFVLIAPDGSVAWNYLKAYTVPVVEADVRPGPPVLPVHDAPFGRLGGAICFDLDHPSYILQVGPGWGMGGGGR